MFYSETLLQKSGPLARVWLSANIERKLSKTHVLQSNLQDSIDEILKPNQAPLALRLSSQLLLGVVRIYSRKARYLLDDCNEALMKIKMAFRSTGNNDLAASVSVPNREALMLPDRITANDNLELLPPPDASWLLSQMDDVANQTPLRSKARANIRDINLQEDFTNSQYLNDATALEDELAMAQMDDLDLELDFGMDLDDGPARLDRSIEMGRAAAVGNDDDDMFSELDMQPKGKERANRDQSTNLDLGDGVHIMDLDGDIQMRGDDFPFHLGDNSATPVQTGANLGRARISESPLSDLDEDAAREMEAMGMNGEYDALMEANSGGAALRKEMRAKKRKVLLPDQQTMLSSTHIKEQQQHHDNILKPQSFLPREPYVLTLMAMHKNGAFVNSILHDTRASMWAPELAGLLSVDAIYRGPDLLKRKRDSGIADMDGADHLQKSPRLELQGDDPFGEAPADITAHRSAVADGTVLNIAAVDEGHDDDTGMGGGGGYMPGFDETMAPAVHPADSGPVSMGTRHAVHVLRDLFGAEAATNADRRKKTSIVFQELLPERSTTRADATKMFFECLVLATKDAIKVEQQEGSLGGPIRVRGKRGLWGDWAEREAGGEMQQQLEQEEQQQQEQRQGHAGPSGMAAQVAVGA